MSGEATNDGGVADVGPVPVPDTRTEMQDILTYAVGIAAAVGVLIGHPFDSAAVTAAVPSVALLMAGLYASVRAHIRGNLKTAQYAAQAQAHLIQLRAASDMRVRATAPELQPLTAELVSGPDIESLLRASEDRIVRRLDRKLGGATTANRTRTRKIT